MTLTDGVRAFVDGVSLVRAGGLTIYLWLPAVVSLTIVGLGVWVAFGYAEQFGAYMVAWLPDWLDFLNLVVVPILYLLAVLVGTWLFGFVAVILSSPFHSNLSADLEAHLKPAKETVAPRPWSEEIWAAISREARKLRYQLPRLLIVGLLSLIPPINLIAPVLWFFLGAWMLAVQFSDLPAENRQHPFTDTLEVLRQHRSAALGFGACVTPLLAIPLINFAIIPLAVAGGTVLWHRMYSES